MLGLRFIPITFLRVLLILACFLLSCLVIGNPSQKYCDPSALLALKEFAGNLTNGSIILTRSNECGNNGGSAAARRVTVLNLSGRGLRGVISHSLGSLDQLKLLHHSFNHLEGGLPAELSNLKKLEVLNLSHNMLMGSVFGSLVGLNSTISLNISSNSFTGHLSDFVRFPNLAVLNLSSNSFTGGRKSDQTDQINHNLLTRARAIL